MASTTELLTALVSYATIAEAEKYLSPDAISTALEEYGETPNLDAYQSVRAFDRLKQRLIDPNLRLGASGLPAITPKTRTPSSMQRSAISAVCSELESHSGFNRKVSIGIACGGGKSLVSYWVGRQLNPLVTLYFVPTRALVTQTLRSWHLESQADARKTDFVAVGSQLAVSALASTDYSVSSTTSTAELLPALDAAFQTQKPLVIFSTYDSQRVVTEALRTRSDTEIEQVTAFFDEAHNLTGESEKLSLRVILDQDFVVKNRIFMSGSPKDIQFDQSQISSYDSEIFGKFAFTYTFAEAIQDEILTDYVVEQLSDDVTKSKIQKAFETTKRKLKPLPDEYDMVWNAVALLDQLQEHPELRKTIAFQPTIEDSKRFRDVLVAVAQALRHGSVNFLHVDGESTSRAAQVLQEFRSASAAVLTNSKYFVEGLDVPDVDSVYLPSARSTGGAVAQIIGRATRRAEGKKLARIFAPLSPFSPEPSDSYAHMILNMKYLQRACTFLQESIGTRQRTLPLEAQLVFVEELPKKPLTTVDDIKAYFSTGVDIQLVQKLNRLSGNDGFKMYQLLDSIIHTGLALSGITERRLPEPLDAYQLCSSVGFDDLLGAQWKASRVINVTRSRAARHSRL